MTALKAYKVTEPCEGYGSVVFASNGAAARREGAQRLDVSFEEVESCVRVPAFDSFAPGPVPRSAMLDAGWWFECSCHDCGSKVQLAHDEDEDEDEDDAPAMEPVTLGQWVFCNATCMGRHIGWNRGREAAEAALCELIYTRWPEARIKRVHVYGDRLECSKPREGLKCGCWFTLPGMQFDIQYNFGEREYWVSRADEAAFKAKYGQGQ